MALTGILEELAISCKLDAPFPPSHARVFLYFTGYLHRSHYSTTLKNSFSGFNTIMIDTQHHPASRPSFTEPSSTASLIFEHRCQRKVDGLHQFVRFTQSSSSPYSQHVHTTVFTDSLPQHHNMDRGLDTGSIFIGVRNDVFDVIPEGRCA